VSVDEKAKPAVTLEYDHPLLGDLKIQRKGDKAPTTKG
jgi:hypothetical protein